MLPRIAGGGIARNEDMAGTSERGRATSRSRQGLLPAGPPSGSMALVVVVVFEVVVVVVEVVVGEVVVVEVVAIEVDVVEVVLEVVVLVTALNRFCRTLKRTPSD